MCRRSGVLLGFGFGLQETVLKQVFQIAGPMRLMMLPGSLPPGSNSVSFARVEMPARTAAVQGARPAGLDRPCAIIRAWRDPR